METTPDFMPVLGSGAHKAPEEGACVMEYVSFITGGEWSDVPDCTPLSLASFAAYVNDYIPDEDRSRLMLPLMPRLIGLGQNPEFDEMLAEVLYKEARDHCMDVDPAGIFGLAHLLDGTCSVTHPPNCVGHHRPVSVRGRVHTALDGLSVTMYGLLPPFFMRRTYVRDVLYPRLVEALDQYDEFVGRTPVEALTEEQMVAVREVHDKITASA
jgi:hypothetical protein